MGGNKKKKIELKAAPWVDKELKDSIKLRSNLSKAWRHARKRNEPKEVLDEYEDRYFLQKSRTAILTGDKKSRWEESKIAETWGKGKTFWKMIKELLGKDGEGWTRMGKDGEGWRRMEKDGEGWDRDGTG